MVGSNNRRFRYELLMLGFVIIILSYIAFSSWINDCFENDGLLCSPIEINPSNKSSQEVQFEPLFMVLIFALCAAAFYVVYIVFEKDKVTS